MTFELRKPVAAVVVASTALAGTLTEPTAAHESAPGDVYWEYAHFRIGNFSGCVGEYNGGAVRGLQTFLWASGAYGQPTSSNKNKVDGIWGSQTKQAVINFQNKHSIGADGCAGVATWRAVRDGAGSAGLREVGRDAANASAIFLKFREPRVSSWWSGTTPPEIKVVKENWGGGCFWYEWSGWRTFAQGGLTEDQCWHEYPNEWTGGVDHIGWGRGFTW